MNEGSLLSAMFVVLGEAEWNGPMTGRGVSAIFVLGWNGPMGGQVVIVGQSAGLVFGLRVGWWLSLWTVHFGT